MPPVRWKDMGALERAMSVSDTTFTYILDPAMSSIT